MEHIEFSGIFNLIKDSKGNDYFGIHFQPYLFKEYEQFMLEQGLGEELSLKLKRDNGNYHITVFNAKEWGMMKQCNLQPEILDNYLNKHYKIFSYGIGKAQQEENNAYFLVCPDESLNNLRTRFNFKFHHFHITLGFKEKDIFGVDKGIDTIIFQNQQITNRSKKLKI